MLGIYVSSTGNTSKRTVSDKLGTIEKLRDFPELGLALQVSE